MTARTRVEYEIEVQYSNGSWFYVGNNGLRNKYSSRKKTAAACKQFEKDNPFQSFRIVSKTTRVEYQTES